MPAQELRPVDGRRVCNALGVPSCSSSPEQPRQVFIYHKRYAVSWKDSNETGPETAIETSETFPFPSALDGGWNIREQILLGIILN